MEESPRAVALTSRFVAGRQAEDALRVTAQLNRAGLMTTLDYLGESVTTTEEAAGARDVYLGLIEQIFHRGLQANVSLKLTQLGLEVAEAACRENVAAVARRAGELGNFVRVDMESSAHTGQTLALVQDLYSTYGNLGVVLQAYLRRTDADTQEMIRLGIRVRLCKGAYDEPASVAYRRRREVDANFHRSARRLLAEGDYPALATHDERLLREAVAFAAQRHLPKDRYEIQMLYGIRRGLQRSLAAQGHRVRVYVPFGGAWYPYFMRRLAERPANAWFVARNIWKG